MNTPKMTLIFFIALMVFSPAIADVTVGSEIPITLSVVEVKLENVLKIISEKSELSFIPDPLINDKLITIELSDVTPSEALNIIAQLYNLGFQELGSSGKYVVTEISAMAVETEVGFYTCEFAQAERILDILSKFTTPDVGRIVIDERTNTVIFQDTYDNILILEQIIKSLDRASKQVYIKSIIAEVSLSKSSNAGVQWFTKNNQTSVGTDFGLKTVPSVLPELPGRPAGTGLGIGILDMDIDIAISMLSTTNDLNLLSTPYLITLDNQWAEIEVGDQIPYQKLNEFGVTSYEFKDATVRLALKPHINNDSTITIQLEPQANFQQGFTPDGVPIISTRKARTQVVVKSGETLVIGGIMQESDVLSESKVPILGGIPLLGNLFKSKKISKQKTELIIMLMPEIVGTDFSDMTDTAIDDLPDKMKENLK